MVYLPSKIFISLILMTKGKNKDLQNITTI